MGCDILCFRWCCETTSDGGGGKYPTVNPPLARTVSRHMILVA